MKKVACVMERKMKVEALLEDGVNEEGEPLPVGTVAIKKWRLMEKPATEECIKQKAKRLVKHSNGERVATNAPAILDITPKEYFKRMESIVLEFCEHEDTLKVAQSFYHLITDIKLPDLLLPRVSSGNEYKCKSYNFFCISETSTCVWSDLEAVEALLEDGVNKEEELVLVMAEVIKKRKLMEMPATEGCIKQKAKHLVKHSGGERVAITPWTPSTVKEQPTLPERPRTGLADEGGADEKGVCGLPGSRDLPGGLSGSQRLEVRQR